MIIIENIENVLNKALGISKVIKINVKEFNEGQIGSIEAKELTYLQIGTIMFSNHKDIKEIHIIYKE